MEFLDGLCNRLFCEDASADASGLCAHVVEGDTVEEENRSYKVNTHMTSILMNMVPILRSMRGREIISTNLHITMIHEY